MSKASAILQRAKARIADIAHWTQGSLARDASFEVVDDVHAAAACRWCARGSLLVELEIDEEAGCPSYQWTRAHDGLQKAAADLDPRGVPSIALVNDCGYRCPDGLDYASKNVATHATVLRMFDLAIDYCARGEG